MNAAILAIFSIVLCQGYLTLCDPVSLSDIEDPPTVLGKGEGTAAERVARLSKPFRFLHIFLLDFFSSLQNQSSTT